MMTESNYDGDSNKKVTYPKVSRTLSKRTSAGFKVNTELDMPFMNMNPNVPDIKEIKLKNEPYINQNYLCFKNGLLRIALIVNYLYFILF